ncbi:DUF6266 family protein [Breznakiella homolactica]|uniref:Uncharacterized protein n=1 Tax=Breznakiella homolactica TaxID=2798577 RepID=A0A7T8B8M7_9SPIR|nr:DUF6266 family protein [Breznakiella homolactica]QQO08764.1 DUF6266 family protein [Breznakiella homolactica]
MAITNIVSGELRNKVGALVGAKWKGISYVRAYVKQKDANTGAQRAVRDRFGRIALFGSAINEGVLKPYQAKALRNLSPFNRFIKINREFIADPAAGYWNIRIFSGNLPVAEEMSVTASAMSGTVELLVTPLCGGSAHRHDTLIAVVYNETSDTYGWNTIDRGTGDPVAIAVPVFFREGDVLNIYLTASRKGSCNGYTLYTDTIASA